MLRFQIDEVIIGGVNQVVEIIVILDQALVIQFCCSGVYGIIILCVIEVLVRIEVSDFISVELSDG